MLNDTCRFGEHMLTFFREGKARCYCSKAMPNCILHILQKHNGSVKVLNWPACSPPVENISFNINVKRRGDAPQW